MTASGIRTDWEVTRIGLRDALLALGKEIKCQITIERRKKQSAPGVFERSYFGVDSVNKHKRLTH